MEENFDTLIDHYKNPRNYGVILSPSSSAEALNLSCGDKITFYIKVHRKVVRQAKFIGEGCSVALGVASFLAEFAENKTLLLLSSLQLEDIESKIGIVFSLSRKKCASVPLAALNSAAKNLVKRSKALP